MVNWDFNPVCDISESSKPHSNLAMELWVQFSASDQLLAANTQRQLPADRSSKASLTKCSADLYSTASVFCIGKEMLKEFKTQSS